MKAAKAWTKEVASLPLPTHLSLQGTQQQHLKKPLHLRNTTIPTIVKRGNTASRYFRAMHDVEAVQVLTDAEGGEEAGDELQVEDAVQGAVGPLVAVDGFVQLVEGGGYQLGVEDEGVEGTGGEAHVERYDAHEEGEDGDVDGQQVVQPAPGVVLAPDAHHRIGVDGRCPSLQTLAAYVAPPTSG